MIALKNYNYNDQQFNRHEFLIKFRALSFDTLIWYWLRIF